VGAHAVAVAGDVDDDRAVQEPVQHGGGDGGVGEDLAPAADAPVGGQDDRAAQVALADDLEQGVGVLAYIPFDPDAAALFFSLISSRYERASLIVSSNKTFSAWAEIFGDATAVEAMVDRLVRHAAMPTTSIRGCSATDGPALRAHRHGWAAVVHHQNVSASVDSLNPSA
jgi:hypothetical protein